MIVVNERAKDGLELFDNNGAQAFEMKNETLKMCADEDGSLWSSVRSLDLLDENGRTLLSLSWSETGLCGTLHDNDLCVEIKEEF